MAITPVLAYNEKTWLPFKLHDLLCMSFGWLSNNSSSAIMRGPMVMGIVEQILNNTLWGDIDYLILDLPPGTGDVQLSLCQKLSLSGSVIVTTPQILSLADTEKGIRMFSKLRVPVNAVVHNMAYFKCEHGTVYHPFGTVNRNALQKKFAIPNAFELPIDLALSKSDELPVVCEHPETPIADTFTNIAESVGMIGACDDRSSAIWCVADTFERRSTRSPSRRMTESSCARSPPPPPKRSK